MRKNKLKDDPQKAPAGEAAATASARAVIKAGLEAPPEDDTSPKDVLWQRPGFLVRRLHQIHVAMFMEECADHAVTPMQYAVLTALAVQPGLDQVSIGQEVGLDRTTTAEVVKRLEDAGLVSRRVHPTDRRARQVFLRAAGEKLVAEMHANMGRAQERLLSPLRPAERAMFMQLLSTLVEANNQYSRSALRSSL